MYSKAVKHHYNKMRMIINIIIILGKEKMNKSEINKKEKSDLIFLTAMKDIKNQRSENKN